MCVSAGLYHIRLTVRKPVAEGCKEVYDKEAEDSCLPDHETGHVESQPSTITSGAWLLRFMLEKVCLSAQLVD